MIKRETPINIKILTITFFINNFLVLNLKIKKKIKIISPIIIKLALNNNNINDIFLMLV